MKAGMLFRHPDKADGASIRRKGRADVISRVRGQPHGRRRANQLDVDIEVVLLLPVPGKGHLIAVRGKARGLLRTRIAGERDHFGCGLPVFWQSRERASQQRLSPRQRVQLPPKPRSAESAEPRVVSRPACPSRILPSVPPAPPSHHPYVESAAPALFANSD